MKKITYKMEKNPQYYDEIDLFICSNYSPVLVDQNLLVRVKLLFVVEVDDYIQVGDIRNTATNCKNSKVDFSNIDTDYGITRILAKILNSGMSENSKVYLDTCKVVLPIYTFIYRYLKNEVKVKNIDFIYREYIQYDNPYDYKLHQGKLTSWELECFGGTVDQKLEANIYFLGFEGGLSQAIERFREPEMKILLNGCPSYMPHYKDISKIMNAHLRANKYKEDFYSATNPYEVYNKIAELYEDYAIEYQLVLALCGSTPSCIGAVAYANDHTGVRIVYSRPNAYKFSSSELLNTWIYSNF